MKLEGVSRLATLCEGIAEAGKTLTWPSARYATDIEGFAGYPRRRHCMGRSAPDLCERHAA